MSKWQKVKIGELLKRYKNPVSIQDNVKYKRVTIRTKHQGITARDEKIGKKIGTKKQFTIKSGQFLLSKIDARYGAFGTVSEELEGAIITGNFWAYDVNNALIDVDFFNQFTNSLSFYDLCERSSSGITHRKYLDEKKFLNFELNIPSISEQKNIVSRNNKMKLENDRLKFQGSFQQSHLKLLRQQILQDAISGKLTADWRAKNPEKITGEYSAGHLLAAIKAEKKKLIAEKKIKKEKPLPSIAADEVPFDVPDGWEWCRLREVVYYKLGKTPPSKDERYWNNGNYEWVSISDMTEYGTVKETQRKITELAVDKVFKYPPIPKGTLLMSFKLTIGKTSILGVAGYHNEAIISIYPFHDEYKKFLFYFLPIFSQWGNKRKAIKGNTLNSKKLDNLTIPLPPRAEQRAIVAKVESLFAYLSQLEEKIQQNAMSAEHLMQAFLGEVFRK